MGTGEDFAGAYELVASGRARPVVDSVLPARGDPRRARAARGRRAARQDRPHDLMPLRNRVTPLGELIETPERGLVYGNRGRLHDADRRIRRQPRRPPLDRVQARVPRTPPRASRCRRAATRASSSSTTRPRSRPGTGPCAECRHEDYRSFLGLVRRGRRRRPRRAAPRGTLRRRRPHCTSGARELPDGAFVLLDGAPWLVLGDGSCAGRRAATQNGDAACAAASTSSRRRRACASSPRAGPAACRSSTRPAEWMRQRVAPDFERDALTIGGRPRDPAVDDATRVLRDTRSGARLVASVSG